MLSHDMASPTAIADGKMASAAVVQRDRSKSPKVRQTVYMGRRETQYHHYQHQQQQQQHLIKAAELLKRVAGKQLTGSSLAERLLVDKVTKLSAVKSPSMQTDAAETGRKLSEYKTSKGGPQVTGMPTHDTQVVAKPDNSDDIGQTAESARRHLSGQSGNTMSDHNAPIVDNVTSERHGNLVAGTDTKETTAPPTAQSNDQILHCSQPEVHNQDDSDLRTVSTEDVSTFCDSEHSHFKFMIVLTLLCLASEGRLLTV